LTSHDRKGDTGQATGFYLPEAAHPWAVLKAVGFDVDFTSPKGGKPPMDGVDLDDATNRSAVPIPLDEPHAGRLERRRDVVQVR
jgi:putative intracellular protease/amidase